MTGRHDAVVVGAGAAGIGVAAALSHLDIDTLVVERETIGSSFRQWPDEMRFLTPSYPSNAFGPPDLNAIVPGTSPAVAFDRQQLTGELYAEYLEAVAENYGLDVRTGVEVTDIRSTVEAPLAVDGGTVAADQTGSVGGSNFTVETSDGSISCSFVVWAAGEFSFPRTDVFRGSELCVHNADVDSWAEHTAGRDGSEYVVIGGFESGIDAAINLLERGCSVTVLDRGHPWAVRHPDPSETLSPYTLQRLDSVRDSDRLELIGGAHVELVESADNGRFEVVATPVEDDLPESVATTESDDRGGAFGDDGWQKRTHSRFSVPTRPILATGFDPCGGPLSELFPTEDGTVRLTDRDESPETPGLFLAGPAVEHDGQAFCFIYKYRSRFPVIAETIGDRLGVETAQLESYREAGMFLDDLSCCEPIDCDC